MSRYKIVLIESSGVMLSIAFTCLSYIIKSDYSIRGVPIDKYFAMLAASGVILLYLRYIWRRSRLSQARDGDTRSVLLTSKIYGFALVASFALTSIAATWAMGWVYPVTSSAFVSRAWYSQSRSIGVMAKDQEPLSRVSFIAWATSSTRIRSVFFRMVVKAEGSRRLVQFVVYKGVGESVVGGRNMGMWREGNEVVVLCTSDNIGESLINVMSECGVDVPAPIAVDIERFIYNISADGVYHDAVPSGYLPDGWGIDSTIGYVGLSDNIAYPLDRVVNSNTDVCSMGVSAFIVYLLWRYACRDWLMASGKENAGRGRKMGQVQ